MINCAGLYGDLIEQMRMEQDATARAAVARRLWQSGETDLVPPFP